MRSEQETRRIQEIISMDGKNEINKLLISSIDQEESGRKELKETKCVDHLEQRNAALIVWINERLMISSLHIMLKPFGKKSGLRVGRRKGQILMKQEEQFGIRSRSDVCVSRCSGLMLNMWS